FVLSIANRFVASGSSVNLNAGLGVSQGLTATTFTVNSTADTDDGSCDPLDANDATKNCTLREAINAANNHTGTDTIDFSVTGEITLTSALPDIADHLIINGPGANLLTVKRDSGASNFRIFEIMSGTVAINGLTISGGKGTGATFRGGGGIYNIGGTLTVSDCTFSDNSGVDTGGGAIYNSATLTVINSTFSGNGGFAGGAISNERMLTISNSTFFDNGGKFGGAILNGGSMTVSNSTIYGNSAGGDGGGINNAGTLNLRSSIVANNTAIEGGPDIFGAVTTGDYNLIKDTNGIISLPGTHNITGSDPQLDPAGLKDNGGPTKTIALLCGSPAIDKGINPDSLSTDQRGSGFARTFDEPMTDNGAGDGTDIGAYEVQQACNQPPVAMCKDISVSANSSCVASILAADVDNGSFDPDNGDSIASRTLDSSGPFTLGPHTVKLTVTDAHGGSNSCTSTVTVSDTTAPSITLNGASPMTVEACSTFTDPGATASDNCSGNLTSAIVVTGSVNTSVPGTYTLHYNVKDESNNPAREVTRTVRVVDTTAPVISGVSVNPSVIWPPNKKMVNVTVNYSTSDCRAVTTSLSISSNEPTKAGEMVVVNPHLVRLIADRLGSGRGRIYTITIKATDASGNVTTKTVTGSVPHDQGK
ncbi:MAG: DUF5011 domain-containing protein, partial [Acidobacteriota bacterium]|nr:DUF5011 domain-containing protein [Acidobacteriota bacterium]